MMRLLDLELVAPVDLECVGTFVSPTIESSNSIFVETVLLTLQNIKLPVQPPRILLKQICVL